MEFIPLIGYISKEFSNITKKNDFAYRWRQFGAMEPKPKAMGGNVGPHVSVALIDPNLIKEFLTNYDQYYKHPGLYDILNGLLGRGLITAEGPSWKRHRKMVSMAFHYELLKNMIPEVVSIASELLDDAKKGDLNKVSVLSLFQGITGEVVGRLFFGQKFCKETVNGMRLTDFMASMTCNIGVEVLSLWNILFGGKVMELGILPRHKKLKQGLQKIQEIAQTTIGERFKAIQEEEKQGRSNPLRTMIDIFYDHRVKMAEEALSDKEIIDEFITFFLAGMDTTGHLLTMASYYLLKNPQYKNDLLKEIDETFSKPLTLDTLNSMNFMTAFMS